MPQMPPTFPQRFPGHALISFRRDPIRYLRRAASECGDIVHLPIRRVPIILINHPDLIKDVLLTRQKQFQKGRGLQQMKRLLGEGLLTSGRPDAPAAAAADTAGLSSPADRIVWRCHDPLCRPNARPLAGRHNI